MVRNCIVAALCLMGAGCRDNLQPFAAADLSHVRDAGAGTDGPAGVGSGGGSDLEASKYTDTTVHNIDTGVVVKNQPVKLTGVVAVTPVTSFISKGQICKYELWVQDP